MVNSDKRFVNKSDIQETSNYVFLKVICTYGSTEISFLKDEVEDRGLQFVFSAETLKEKALTAAFKANKGMPQFIAGVRNLKF